MATTPVCSIDENGITVPTYAEVRSYLVTEFQTIYGTDIDLDADTMDGQLLSIFATAISDCNSMTLAAYNAFSPSTAQGVGLSTVVKINGISRSAASYSTVDLTVVGQAGTTITNGQVQDDAGYYWAFNDTVTIPSSGTITATATCTTEGAITAAVGTITSISTPTRGWQSVTNALAATEGAAVETDATLRVRQKTSVSIPSLTVLEGMVGSVANLTGVTRYEAYENDTDVTDANGIPSHSVCLVVEGGDAATIAQTIASKKTPGCGTYGSVSETVIDTYGVSHIIKFSRPEDVAVTVSISIKALTGYTSSIGTSIKQAVVDYINGLGIGDDVLFTRLYVPANLSNGSNSTTFEVQSILIARDAGTPTAADITIAFDEAASCTTDLVTLTVT
ncbi:baseplate J/gp47 family protein [Allorhizobium ampelinum]|uniref:baseplate J/gp47 family protein n=1 Tax=Allorhizobium ampelinum TaxID=3025782 RepID=UPI000B40266A|nr:baseplate J/gp47 family protein [Allorhizobium ampelinum]NTA27388.1 hypothetical protein [Allorhizobium ampelinum]OVE94443.1 hypothetical protein B7W85_12900 [Allorhizobium ampelinum]